MNVVVGVKALLKSEPGWPSSCAVEIASPVISLNEKRWVPEHPYYY